MKYNTPKIQITPKSPKGSKKILTIIGPTNTGKPAPKFKIERVAPLSFFTNEGIKAVKGTYAAIRYPKQHQQL